MSKMGQWVLQMEENTYDTLSDTIAKFFIEDMEDEDIADEVMKEIKRDESIRQLRLFNFGEILSHVNVFRDDMKEIDKLRKEG